MVDWRNDGDDSGCVDVVDGFKLRRIEVRIRFLKRIVGAGSRITFDDAHELAEWLEELRRLKLSDLDKVGFGLPRVALIIDELDMLISGSMLEELC